MSHQEKDAIAREREVIRRRIHKYAERAGVRLNPQSEIVEAVFSRMAERKVHEGEFYCPDREATGEHDLDRKIVCPCEFHLKEIAEEGRCRCGLFVRSEEEPDKGEA